MSEESTVSSQEKFIYSSVMADCKSVKNWLERHQNFGAFLNNEWVDGDEKIPIRQSTLFTEEKFISLWTNPEKLTEIVNTVKNSTLESRSNGPCPEVLERIAKLVEEHKTNVSALESVTLGQAIHNITEHSVPNAITFLKKFGTHARFLEIGANSWRPKGVVVLCVPSTASVELLVHKLAPIIAAGNSVVICIDVVSAAEKTTVINLALVYLVQLIVDAGLPARKISVVCSKWHHWTCTVLQNADFVAVVGNREVENALEVSKLGTELPMISKYVRKILIIFVFESGDVDSAVEGIIDVMYHANQQLLPSERGLRLLIQESVFRQFKIKLEERIMKLIVRESLDKNADIANDECGLKNSICMALKDADEHCVLIQHNHFELVAFRTVKEAITLGNDTRGASTAHIWSENVSLAFEVSKQLKSSLVLINCSTGGWGIAEYFEDDKPLFPCGGFGDEEDMYTFLVRDPKPNTDSPHANIIHSTSNLKIDLDTVRKAQKNWTVYPTGTRVQSLLSAAKLLDLERANLIALGSLGITSKIIDDAVAIIKRLAFNYQFGCGFLQEFSSTATTLRVLNPIGLVGIVFSSGSTLPAIVYIVTSVILAGNAVVSILDSDMAPILTKIFSTSIPSGLVNFIMASEDFPILGNISIELQTLWYFKSDSSWKTVAGKLGLQHYGVWREPNVENFNPNVANDNLMLLQRCTIPKRICIQSGTIFAN